MEPVTLIAGVGAFLARKTIIRAAKDAVMNHLEQKNLVGEEYYLKKILDSKNHDEAISYFKKLKIKFPDSPNIPVIVELLVYTLNKRKNEIEEKISSVTEGIKKAESETEKMNCALKKCEKRIVAQIKQRKKLILTRPLLPSLICIPLVFVCSGIVYHPDAAAQRIAASIVAAGMVFAISSIIVSFSLGKNVRRQMEVKQEMVDLIGHFHVRRAAMESDVRSLRTAMNDIGRRTKHIYEIGGVEHA